jgi:hypothetical protein
MSGLHRLLLTMLTTWTGTNTCWYRGREAPPMWPPGRRSGLQEDYGNALLACMNTWFLSCCPSSRSSGAGGGRRGAVRAGLWRGSCTSYTARRGSGPRLGARAAGQPASKPASQPASLTGGLCGREGLSLAERSEAPESSLNAKTRSRLKAGNSQVRRGVNRAGNKWRHYTNHGTAHRPGATGICGKRSFRPPTGGSAVGPGGCSSLQNPSAGNRAVCLRPQQSRALTQARRVPR